MSVEDVRTLLQKFQDGYTRRKPGRLDEFMQLFVEDENLEIIGTNAVQPGEGEWCLGLKAARQLVASDWENWGDVAYDVQGAHIHVLGNVAWLATSGTVSDRISLDRRYHGYLDYVRQILNRKDLDARDKTLDIVQLGTDIVVELPKGEKYVWPFRFTAVAVRMDGAWKFHQMTFSFATTRAPDVRFA